MPATAMSARMGPVARRADPAVVVDGLGLEAEALQRPIWQVERQALLVRVVSQVSRRHAIVPIDVLYVGVGE
jgi:hypothetical protein